MRFIKNLLNHSTLMSRGVTIHWFNDQQSNSINAKWKHQYISSSLRYAFILNFPWHVCVTIHILNIKTVLAAGRQWQAARKIQWGYLQVLSHTCPWIETVLRQDLRYQQIYYCQKNRCDIALWTMWFTPLSDVYIMFRLLFHLHYVLVN